MSRLEIIKSMYAYKATEEDIAIIPNTFELIDNWYLDGFKTIKELETVFNDIEDLYDLDIDLKIYPKDLYYEPISRPI